MSIDTLINALQGTGCSPFFFTSAFQSSLFGEIGRQNQVEIMESNLEFRARLQDLKNQYSKERLDAQKRFRRESYEFGRQYLIQQTIAQNISRQKQIEFQDFINNYWPLKQSPFSILKERQEYLQSKAIVPLTILVAKTELTSATRDTAKYGDFCEDLITALQTRLPNIIIEKAPWTKSRSCQSRLGEAMNINYLMSGIPTLVIFPYQMKDSIGVETAAWSFGRGLQSMSHNKTFIFNNVPSNLIEETTFAAVQATIGMNRDAYMLAEYHAPTVFNHIADDSLLAIPEIRTQLEYHYSDLSKLVGTSEFQQLCSEEELRSISSSLNSKLLNS